MFGGDVVIEKKNKDSDLDSFWDISSLVPERSFAKRTKNNVTLTQINTNEKVKGEEGNNKLTYTSSIIERKISEHHSKSKDTYGDIFSYTPSNSLIHNVTLKKRLSSLTYYDDFVKDAQRYSECKVDNAEFVPFFSYVPQYNQLDKKQLAYYFYWRSKARESIFEDTDYSYILLYVFELLNLADIDNALDYQIKLTDLWNHYGRSYPMLSNKLILWICDFSLIYQLPPPHNMSRHMVSEAQSLKEFFISIPDNDLNACVSSLLKYCTSYDYHTSKFATDDNLSLYDKHVRGALRTAVDFFSENGKILSKLSYEDSFMIRDSFSGALCSSKIRYSIEIKYCSFSRSNELRYLVGDIVKYAENKIRAHLGIKSRLTVYSISAELKEKIDAYFSDNLSCDKIRPAKEEKHDYDVLYDLPVKPLSLKNALAIEEASWETTNELVDAFTKIGALKTAEICKKALAVFNGKVPTDRDEREELLDSLDCDDVLSECDDEFYEYEDKLEELNYTYIMDHRSFFD